MLESVTLHDDFVEIIVAVLSGATGAAATPCFGASPFEQALSSTISNAARLEFLTISTLTKVALVLPMIAPNAPVREMHF